MRPRATTPGTIERPPHRHMGRFCKPVVLQTLVYIRLLVYIRNCVERMSVEKEAML